MIQSISSIIHYTFFFPVFIIFMTILLLASLIKFEWFFKLTGPVCRIFMTSLGAKVKVEGTFPENGSYVVMSNHSSFIDPFIYPFFMKGIFTGIVARYNFKYPIWAQVLKRARVIPVDRKNRERAIESIKKAEKVLKQGIHIAILPEGTRTLTGKLGIMKKGGFHLAINTGASIIPVGIEGAYKFKPKSTWKLSKGIITARVGNPISSKSLGLEGLINKVEHELKRLSGELNLPSSQKGDKIEN